LFDSKLLFCSRFVPGGVEVAVGGLVGVEVGDGAAVFVAVGAVVLVGVGGAGVLVAVGDGVEVPLEVKKLEMTCPRLSTGAGRPIEPSLN